MQKFFMTDDSNDADYMKTPGHRSLGSGQVVIQKKRSNLCFRGSHEGNTAKRTCKGYIGKDKSTKCECDCHG